MDNLNSYYQSGHQVKYILKRQGLNVICFKNKKIRTVFAFYFQGIKNELLNKIYNNFSEVTDPKYVLSNFENILCTEKLALPVGDPFIQTFVKNCQVYRISQPLSTTSVTMRLPSHSPLMDAFRYG